MPPPNTLHCPFVPLSSANPLHHQFDRLHSDNPPLLQFDPLPSDDLLQNLCILTHLITPLSHRLFDQLPLASPRRQAMPPQSKVNSTALSLLFFFYDLLLVSFRTHGMDP
jgi:hypothetical protein